MKVGDTSALYAVLDVADAHHAAAVAELELGVPVLVPAEVLAETANLLVRRQGPRAGVAAAKALRNLPGVEVQPTWDEPWDNILDRAWTLFEDGVDPSYVDCVVIAWCKKRGLRPWTYDQRILAACA